nr:hypothetical protein BaRGS_013383 [Batillaria attramentaria]
MGSQAAKALLRRTYLKRQVFRVSSFLWSWLQVSDADGRALLQCLKDPAGSLTRITIGEADYRCFQGNDNSLVGKAVNNKDRVLVARLTDEVLVLVLGSSKGHGSFLFEVKRSLLERQQRLLSPQQPVNGAGGGAGATSQLQVQQGQGQQKLVLPPGAGPVGQEQVLVQLHD